MPRKKAKEETPEERGEWLRTTRARIEEKRSSVSARGSGDPARWDDAETRAAAEEEGEAGAGACRPVPASIAEMTKQFRLLKFALTTTVATFAPAKHTLMVCGRPTQVVY